MSSLTEYLKRLESIIKKRRLEADANNAEDILQASSVNVDVQVIDTNNTPIVIDLCSPPSTPMSHRNTTRNDDDVIDLTSPVMAVPTTPHRNTIAFEEITPQRLRRRQSDSDSGLIAKRQKNSSEELNSELDHALKCPVCLENMLQREPSTTKCGHIFYGSCIRQAISSTEKCPLCNKPLNARNLTRLYF